MLCILFQNIDSVVAQSSETAGNQPQHTVLLKVDDDITCVFIVRDTAVVKVPKLDILDATPQMLLSYYVFDLEYPIELVIFFKILSLLWQLVSLI
jgi:hypothetical protein